MPGVACCQGGGDEGFAEGELGSRGRGNSWWDSYFGYAEAAGGEGEGGVGAAVEPATAKGDVDAQTEGAGGLVGEGDGVEEAGGEVG